MKPSIPQGTRDFSPSEVRKRHFLLNVLKDTFELYGFQPLETPSMEQLSTLIGKYGDEGDKLIFKVLNNGLHLPEKHDKARRAFEQHLEGRALSELTERALRYDLTIPFARYVAMHQNDLVFPFRRYQMQPVWRADRPQKGRYREFWQCDCDVVGTTSLINEADLICIYQRVFHQLGVPEICIRINDRKVLAGIAEVAGIPEKMMEMTVALDKLDKIGWEGVQKELARLSLTPTGIEFIHQSLNLSGNNEKRISLMKDLLASSQTGREGLEEVEKTLDYHRLLQSPQWQSEVVFDVSLARGLNYYTGVIMEVAISSVKIGSLGGGGRYDELTALFGLPGISGVGISFGIDRIYDVMETLELFPGDLDKGAQALIVNFGEENEMYGLQILQHLRRNNIVTEMYPEASRFDKQLRFANRRNIPFVILPGEEERVQNKVSVKDFKTGEQKLLTLEEAVDLLKS